MASKFPNAEFILYHWSGKNSHSARADAAEHFAIEMNKLHGRFPTARHLIVAHSHGGNVALIALARVDRLHCISDVVMLGTPTYKLGVRDWRVAFSIFGFVGAILGFLVGIAPASLLFNFKSDVVDVLAILLGCVTGLAGAFFGYDLASATLHNRLEASATRQALRVAYPNEFGTRVHAWSYADDEARWALAGAALIADSPHRLREFLRPRLFWVCSVASLPFICFLPPLGWLLIVIGESMSSGLSEHWFNVAAAIAASAWLGFAGVELIIGVWMSVWGATRGVGFGSESWALSLFVAIDIASDIPGIEKHVIQTTGERQGILLDRAAYWHGQIYENPEAIEQIVRSIPVRPSPSAPNTAGEK